MNKVKGPKPTVGLSDIEHRVLVGVEMAVKLAPGGVPSVREIANLAGYRSSGTTYRHLKTLAAKGYIRLSPMQRFRGIQLLYPAPRRKA